MKKRMKKQRIVIVSSLLIFLMFFGLWGCGRTQTPPAAVTLYDRGLEVVGLMAEMAGSEDYMGLLTGSSEITERIQTAAQGDYSVPERVYAVSAGAGTFAAGAEGGAFAARYLGNYCTLLAAALLLPVVFFLIPSHGGKAKTALTAATDEESSKN